MSFMISILKLRCKQAKSQGIHKNNLFQPRIEWKWL